MSAVTTTLTEQATRFEAVRLPGGWSVVDLLGKTGIVPKQPWDESTAATAADALNAEPAYVVAFRWSGPDAYQFDHDLQGDR